MHANVRKTSGLIQINGRELKVAAVFENAVVREVSFVAVGADPDTQAQAFSAAASPQEPFDMSDQTETINALKARIAELEAQIEAARIDRRRAELAALFETVGHDLPSDDRPYLEILERSTLPCMVPSTGDLCTVGALRWRRLGNSAASMAVMLISRIAE